MEVVIFLVISRSRICVLNKSEDANLNVYNMITRINESKTLTKHVFVNVIVIVNENLMVENVIPIKSTIKICVDVGVTP